MTTVFGAIDSNRALSSICKFEVLFIEKKKDEKNPELDSLLFKGKITLKHF